MADLSNSQKVQLEKLAIKYKKAQQLQKDIKAKIEEFLKSKDLTEVNTSKAKIKISTYTSKNFDKDKFVNDFGFDKLAEYQTETTSTRLNINVLKEKE